MSIETGSKGGDYTNPLYGVWSYKYTKKLTKAMTYLQARGCPIITAARLQEQEGDYFMI